MTSNPFSSIGPYKGVPADVLSRCALHANDAFDASLVALTRHAAAVGDEAYKDAVIRQSVQAANSVWAAVEADGVSSLRSAKSDYYSSIVPGAVIGAIGLAALLCGTLSHNPGTATFGFTAVVLAAAVTAVLYLADGKSGRKAMKQIAEQGYFDDTLEKSLGRVAGYALLVGGKALHIARRSTGKGKISVTTVYWDAIGHALVEIDGNGLERVDIFGREGLLVASITGPTGYGLDAKGLAGLVAARVADARKAA